MVQFGVEGYKGGTESGQTGGHSEILAVPPLPGHVFHPLCQQSMTETEVLLSRSIQMALWAESASGTMHSDPTRGWQFGSRSSGRTLLSSTSQTNQMV